MCVMKNPTGSTTWSDNDVCYYNFPVDNGYDFFILFICFLIAWWFVLNI